MEDYFFYIDFSLVYSLCLLIGLNYRFGLTQKGGFGEKVIRLGNYLIGRNYYLLALGILRLFPRLNFLAIILGEFKELG